MKILTYGVCCLIFVNPGLATTQLSPDWETKPFHGDVSPDDYGHLYRLFIAEALKSDTVAELRLAGYTPGLLLPQIQYFESQLKEDYFRSVIIDAKCSVSEKGAIEAGTGRRLALIYLSISKIAPPDAEGSAMIQLSTEEPLTLKFRATLTRRGWILNKEQKEEK